MRKPFFLLLCSFLSLFCWSQESELVSSKIDSIKALRLSNPPKTQLLIKQAKKISLNKGSKTYLELLSAEAEFLSSLGKFDDVLIIADSLIHQDISSTHKIQGYIERGIVFAQQNRNTEALENLKLALPIAESINSGSYLSRIFKIMGNLSFTNGSGHEAIQHFKKAASFSIQDKNEIATGLIYNNITRAFESIKMLDSAIYYNNKVLKIVENTSNKGELYFTANLNEADFQNQIGNHETAKNYIKKSLEAAYRIGNPYMIGAALQINSTLYKNKKDYKKAIEEAQKAIDIYDEIGAKSNAMQTRFLLKDYYALSGNYKSAFETSELFRKMEDSLKVIESDKNLKEFRVKYESAEQKLKISEQNADLYKKEQQQKSLLITIGALVLLSVIGFLYYKQRQKTNQQKINNLENEKENIALKSLMTGEEKERSRIAKELHDGLGSILAAAKMHANKEENLPKVIELIDSASRESRRISHNLLPESLLKKGLDTTLNDYIQTINESELINVNYLAVDLKSNLPKSLQLSIYRIIQELLNNIIKHANASEAIIQLQERDSLLLITVEDNGKGFETNTQRKGIGLTNIESRLSLLKGKLKIDSNQKMGTSVYIELKLDN